jgi:hypothetical protein
MTTKEFIEKAIEGGWNGVNPFEVKVNPHDQDVPKKIVEIQESIIRKPYISEILLDPKAWQALGKVEGWGDHNHPLTGTSVTPSCWQCNMHQMTNALIEGKTIEEYLETL